MTPDEINGVIAEHVGWKPVKYAGIPFVNEIPPNYSGDLNALHEALQSLTEVELFRYADEVCDLAYDGHHDADIQMILKMEAKELAECYVRAIGKWRGV